MRQGLQSRSLKLRKILILFLALSSSIWISQLSALAEASQNETDGVFRFHMAVEPQSLDPLRLSSDSTYFFNNLMRGLYSYSNEEGLVKENADSCEFKTPLKLVCQLKRDAKWSDGSAITAGDYARAFKRLLQPQAKNTAVELLKNVKNAIAVHAGAMPSSALGISSQPSGALIIEFEKPDPDFLFKLTSSVLTPIKSEDFPNREGANKTVVNGPYRVEWWKPGRRVRLISNAFYKPGATTRPPVEILFVDDDDTAFNLYKKGELTFLRRLPTTNIPEFKGRPEFYQVPMSRFDYVGFGDFLKDQPELRAALSLSADFKELQKIYDALGIPGCPSLPSEWMEGTHCVTFNLEAAKRHLEHVLPEVRSRRLKLVFSKLGGDDIKKGAEWFQAQWKKNLGLTVDIEANEQGVYLERLRQAPPPIFRKGVGLERPERV